MNNDQFSLLVRERTTSSTREIARQAVESEFRQKRKRRRGDNNGSSSDDEATGDRRQRDKKQQQSKRDNDNNKEEDDEAALELASKYRDRAKERREAKADGTMNLDANDDEAGPQDKEETDDLEQALRHGLQKRQIAREQRKVDQGLKIPETRDEAEAMILSDQVLATSSLGQGLLAYWKSRLAAPVDDSGPSLPTTAGRLVQRTTLVFSADMPDPRNRARAWLMPSEQIRGEDQSGDDAAGGVILKASPLTQPMLQSMKEVLSKQRIKQEQQLVLQTKGEPTGDADDNSDDDIFNAVGSDYEPILVAKKDTGEATVDSKPSAEPKEKSSIFNDDLPNISVATDEGASRSDIKPAASTRLVGFASSANYGLGEDFDNDFDGRSEWDDDDEGDKPKESRKKRKKQHAADLGISPNAPSR